MTMSICTLRAAKIPAHQHALLLAFFDEPSFGVQQRIFTGNAGVGMTHQVEIHKVSSVELRWYGHSVP